MCLFVWLLGLVGYAGFLVFRVLGLLCYCLWVASVVWLYADLDALLVGCFEVVVCLGLCGLAFAGFVCWWVWVICFVAPSFWSLCLGMLFGS